MIWKDYSKLKNTHAFCGASNYHWRNYDIEKLLRSKANSYSSTIGTLLHAYAADSIKNKFKMIKGDKRSIFRYLVIENKVPQNAVDMDRLFPNLMNYINDCIALEMDPEVLLYYSDDFYGTTDAISWENDILKISDLKTGLMPGNFMQLENYAALFCLDYKIKPSEIKKLEFRLYQDSEVLLAEPDPAIIFPIVNQIIEFNKALMEFERR